MSGVPYSSNLPPAKMNQTPDEILADGNPLITGQALLDSADIAVFASTHNDGYHKLPPSGKLIHEHLGSGNIAEIKLSASGYLRTNTIEAGKDDDVTSFLGKAAIGFTGNTVNNGEASFSHLNQQGYTGHSTFAIKQTFDGATSVNSVSGKDTSFEINNLAQMTLCGQTNKVGFLGINQTNPTERVDVVGNIKVTGKIINDEYTTPDDTNLIFYTGAATPVSRLKIIGDTNSSAVGYVAIGPDDPTEKLHVDGNIKVEGTGAGNITASGDISASGINATGNVGINQANPSERLEVVGNIKVEGTGAGNIDASGNITASGDISASGINATGNVGINEANPFERLEVVGNIKVTGKIINDEYTTPDDTNLIFYTGAATPVSRLKIIGDTNSSAVGYVAIGPDDPTEKLHVDGNIKVEGTGAGNINASGTITSSGINAGTITASGIYAINNVGINEANPFERLEVVGNIKVTGKIINDEYTTPDDTNLIFYTGAATPVSRLKIIGDTNSSAVGYVAIGPDDPTEKLHVDGNIKVQGTGNITASGDISATGDVTGANITTLVSGIGDRAQELLDAGLSSVTAGVTTTPYPFGSGHAADTVWASICHTWNAMTLLNGNIGGASLYTYPWTRTSNTVWESISLAGSMITAIQSPGRLYASSYDLGTNLGPTVWAIAGDTTAYFGTTAGGTTAEGSTIIGTGAITLSSGVTVKYLNGIPMWFFGGRDENVDIMSTISTGNTWTIAIAIAKKPESKGVLFNQLMENETNATNHYIQWDGQLSGDEYGNTGNGWTVSAPISIPDESVIVIRKSGTGVDQVEVSLNGGLIGKSQNNETFSGTVNRIRLGQRGRYTNYGDNTPLYMGIAAVAAWQTVLNDTLVSKYLTYQSLTTKA